MTCCKQIALQTSLRTQEERTDAQDQRIQEMVAEALMEHKPAVSPKGIFFFLGLKGNVFHGEHLDTCDRKKSF